MKILIINYDLEICTSRTSLCDGDKVFYTSKTKQNDVSYDLY